MKILFITTINPQKQGDYLELSTLYGLKKILGNQVVDYPKKKILYGDFSESPKASLHGLGFTYLTQPLVDDVDRNITVNPKDFDVVLHGSGHLYGEKVEVDHPNQWWLDGHDLYGEAPVMGEYKGERIIGNQKKPSFKRELVFWENDVHPFGFGIPAYQIRPFNFNKTRRIQSTYPADAVFFKETGTKYKFDNEKDYYDDMSCSWFGLSCKKGGWDTLRTLEIMASGALLLFKDYKNKPPFCAPSGIPTLSYTTFEEFHDVMNKLLVGDKPTPEYFDLLFQQREFLVQNLTCEARALQLLKILTKSINALQA